MTDLAAAPAEPQPYITVSGILDALLPAVWKLAPYAIVAFLAKLAWDSYMLHRESDPGRRGKKGGNTWANRKQIAPLTTPDVGPGRIVALQTKRGLVSLASDHSCLVFGGSTSGKTLRVLVPNLARWAGPAIAVSTKNDLINWTSEDRPDSVVFGPGLDLPDQRMIGWSPLDGIARTLHDDNNPSGAWTAALQRAKAMVATQSLEGVKSGDYWKSAAANALAPLLLAAAAEQNRLNIGNVLSWIQNFEFGEALEILAHNRNLPQTAFDSLTAVTKLSNDMQSGTIGTLGTALQAYNYPDILAGACGPDRFDPRWLLDPNGHMRTLYITSTSALQKDLAPIFNGIIAECVQARYDEADKNALRLKNSRTPAIPDDKRLLLMLDEAANIAPMPNLPDLTSEGASHGLTGIYAYQDFSQIKHSLGEDNARTVFNNCQGRILTPGMADRATLEVFEQLLGRHEVLRRSTTRGGKGETSHTTSGENLPLVEAAEIRTLRDGYGILIYGKHMPVRAKLLPYGHWCTRAQPQPQPRKSRLRKSTAA